MWEKSWKYKNLPFLGVSLPQVYNGVVLIASLVIVSASSSTLISSDVLQVEYTFAVFYAILYLSLPVLRPKSIISIALPNCKDK